MRSRTSNGLEKRAKTLITAIQREYDEMIANQSKKNATNNKENNNELEQKKDKKVKRKSWIPTISFALPNDDELKAKKTKFTELPTENGTSLNASTSNAFASSSGLSNKSVTNGQKALDMPILD